MLWFAIGAIILLALYIFDRVLILNAVKLFEARVAEIESFLVLPHAVPAPKPTEAPPAPQPGTAPGTQV